MTADIRPLGDPATHFWLTRSVARVMGLNLAEALAMNHLSPQDYSELINRCRACPHVHTCHQWLGTPHDRPAPCPDHCVNGHALEALCCEQHA